MKVVFRGGALAFLIVALLRLPVLVDNSSVVLGASSPEARAQVAYANKHYIDANLLAFEDLLDVDCANFVSQTLLARGWSMNSEWFYDIDKGDERFSRSWLSSTAFKEYLDTKPELATPLSWDQRDKIQVGDVVQFDWDASGDRDHTAIVSGIKVLNNERTLLLSSHSPGKFNFPITEQLAIRPKTAVIYFYQLKNKDWDYLKPVNRYNYYY